MTTDQNTFVPVQTLILPGGQVASRGGRMRLKCQLKFQPVENSCPVLVGCDF